MSARSDPPSSATAYLLQGDGRTLGFIGEPTVNVLAVNTELDEKYPGG